MAHLAPILLLSLLLFSPIESSPVKILPTYITAPTSFTHTKSSGLSKLYTINLDNRSETGQFYYDAPMILSLKGNRHQIGYDYASMLHQETSDTLTSFLDAVCSDKGDKERLLMFIDYCWESFLEKRTPIGFLQELEGMKAFYEEKGYPDSEGDMTADLVSKRFYTLANMPADTVNIISMLEQELEQNWPEWLKEIINDIIRILEHLVHSCDAYGVWGSRTMGDVLYTSRNLDYNSNTGINKHKLVVFYDILDSTGNNNLPGKTYSSVGFAFGLGALAGMSQQGVTVSEMNLDNSKVTFSGVPFPLRLRMVLEQSTDLDSAMKVWNATNNTNSFNFLIGSAKDAKQGKNGAYALETIMDFTGQFGANSNIERDATYHCVKDACHKWTNETGDVHIGKPLPEAVWRSNHAFHPKVMETQEALFNNTVFRYNLMHTLFSNLQSAGDKINDKTAVGIAATLGTKGKNYYTCDQPLIGDNVMSIAYVPDNNSPGKLYVAWESGKDDYWRPAACSPYVEIDFSRWISNE